MPDLPAVITAYSCSWVKVAEGMGEETGEGAKEDSGKEKGRESNQFWTKNFLSLSSFKTLTDYVYFDSPEVINKSIAA